jgi:hypothetical protein
MPRNLSFLIFLSFIATFVVAADEPQQIHIALAGKDENGNPNGMAVSWQTLNDTITSIVKYGVDRNNLDSSATGTSSTYFETYDHHVVLENLQSNTYYYYQCGDDISGWSDIFTFTTAPAGTTASDFEEFTLAVIGDMGVQFSKNTMQLLKDLADKQEYKFIWHVGDISYADDGFLTHPLKFTYESIWNEYMNEVQDFTSKFPYMVLPGNHEAECHSPQCQLSLEKLEQLSHFAAYNGRFRMPSPESSGTLNMWYSFNYGPIHFINIDTETDYDNSPLDEYTWMKIFNSEYNGDFGGQIAWLEADLLQASEERDIRPWIFVGGHRPIYSITECNSEGYPIDSSANLQAAVEELFHEYNVDLYLAGHKHAYERQYPVYNSTYETSYENPSFTVHLTDGSAGNIERLSDWSDAENPGWHVTGNNTKYGMSLLTVYNSTTFYWRHLSSDDQQVMDEVVVTKEH